MAVITSSHGRTAVNVRESGGIRRRAGAARVGAWLSSAGAVGIILWLCLRDWLTSSVVQYPYAMSLLDTTAILLGVLVARSALTASRLWELLTLAGGIICVFAYLPTPAAYLFAQYHVVPAVPIFTLALALPRVLSQSVWPRSQDLLRAACGPKQILTTPLRAKVTVDVRPAEIRRLWAKISSAVAKPASPGIQWFLAVAASLASCVLLVFDDRANTFTGRPPILLFVIGLVACLHAMRWVSRRQNASVMPASVLATIFAALYVVSPFASRLAVLVFGDTASSAGASSEALLLNWLLGYSVAPFAASALLDLLTPKKAKLTGTYAVDPAPFEYISDENNIAERSSSVGHRIFDVRMIALGVSTLFCLGLEVNWNAAKPAYYALGLWALSVLICSLTLPHLLSYFWRGHREFWDNRADRIFDRLNEQVDFRGIRWRFVKVIRSFLTWKIDLGAFQEMRRLRSERRAARRRGETNASALFGSRWRMGRGSGLELSSFSIAVWRGMALVVGVLGLLIAPHGQSHSASLITGLWVLAAAVVLHQVGQGARIRRWLQYGALAVICLFPAALALKGEIVLPAYQPYDFRMWVLGQGMERFPSEMGVEFLGEQGMISWLMIGAMLSWGVFRAAAVLGKRKANSILTDGEEDGKGEDGVAMDLFCAAAVTILVTIYYGFSLSNSGVMLSMAISVGVLFAISRTRKTEQQAPGRKRATTIAWAICAGLAVASIVGVNVFAGSVAQGYTPGAPVSYIAWRSTPEPIKKLVTTNVPAAMTWAEGHALIRRCFGSQLDVPLSAPAYVAARMMGADYSTNPLRSAAATLLGMQLNSRASTIRLYELYINLQDYGFIGGPATRERTIGMAQMSQRLFGVAPSALKAEQVDFLIGNPLRVDNLPLLENASPVQFAAAPSRYTYTHFETKGLPQVGGWEMHNGVLNNKDQYASHMIATGSYPYASTLKGAVPLSSYNNATEAWSINDAGEIAGSSVGWAAYWDKAGDIHNLGTLPGFASCAARAINNRGEVAGYAWNTDASEGQHQFLSTAHAFLWSHGQMHDLGVPVGYVSSRAYAMNDRGEAAGWMLTKSGQTHAMVWRNGVMIDLGTLPGGQTSVANAINNAGQIVGSSQGSDGKVSACLWQYGRVLNLGRLPGDVYSRAQGINDLGQIVGESRLDTNVNYPGGTAFLWDAQHGMRDLVPMFSTDPVWRKKITHCTMGVSINNRGNILGYGFYEAVAKPRTHFLLNSTH